MRTKWMVFLLGISFLNGCKTFSEYYYSVEYAFCNNTEHQIEIRSFGNIISTNKKLISQFINKGDTITVIFEGEISEEYREMETELTYLIDNLKAYRFFGDSSKVYFDQKRYLRISVEDKNFIYNKSRYTSTRKGDREFKHLFVFTEEDYNNAIPIETE